MGGGPLSLIEVNVPVVCDRTQLGAYKCVRVHMRTPWGADGGGRRRRCGRRRPDVRRSARGCVCGRTPGGTRRSAREGGCVRVYVCVYMVCICMYMYVKKCTCY